MGLGAVAMLMAAACPGEETPVPQPPPDYTITHEGQAWYMSLVQLSATERWIVGGEPAAGVILHDTGNGPDNVPIGTDVPLLNWIHRFDDGTFRVVGNEGTALRSADGAAWSVEATATDQDLWGVWGASQSDVWAVGGNADGTGVPTVLRDTGSGWEAVTLPTLQKPGVQALFKVWGTGADNVYIVGQKGLVLHWNGTELVEELVGASVDLVSVWGTGPNQIAAVGGRINGIVSLWDGTEWRTLQLAPLLGLNGVWMRAGKVHAVGAFGTAARIDFATGVVEDFKLETNVDLHAVHGSPDGVMATGGGNFIAANGPYQGVIAERDLNSDE